MSYLRITIAPNYVGDFRDANSKRTRNERIGLDFSVQFQVMEFVLEIHRHRRSDQEIPVSGYRRIY